MVRKGGRLDFSISWSVCFRSISCNVCFGTMLCCPEVRPLALICMYVLYVWED